MNLSVANLNLLLSSLPNKPGVYQMFDADNKVLYVGKARNLKSRVSGYFRGSGLSTKTLAMVAKISEVRITLTQSETEALLLEQTLIKTERPPYNVTLRDDKSYPYILLTDHAHYPRLTFHRGVKHNAGRYFGPFPSAGAVRESLSILQKLFHIRQCDDVYFKNRSRPCLQHQIKRCSAPCVGLIDESDYREDVRLAELFLEGRSQAVLDIFKKKMNAAAAVLDFEQAAKCRDQIKQLRRVQEQQYVHGEAGDVDVFALHEANTGACVQALFLRGGRMLGQRTWFPKNELELVGSELLEAFISQFYFGGAVREIPRQLVLSHQLNDQALLASALSDAGKRRVRVSSAVRGQRARWLELARANAVQSLEAYLGDRRNMLSRFIALQEALMLDEMPQRLECFDISHTMGDATVASCVVFNQEGPLKSDYRRFNIENITPGDDYAAMEQAIHRRYTRLQRGEGPLPDILVIDGGKGQLSRAQAVMEDLQVTGIMLLGIAKGPTRKPEYERYFVSDTEVELSSSPGAQQLLQQLRDEAHRFAITGHRQRRQKGQRRSQLDEIAGIGPKRKRELLSHFGGIPPLKGASIEEIAKVPGISQKLAKEIYGSLHTD